MIELHHLLIPLTALVVGVAGGVAFAWWRDVRSRGAEAAVHRGRGLTVPVLVSVAGDNRRAYGVVDGRSLRVLGPRTHLVLDGATYVAEGHREHRLDKVPPRVQPATGIRRRGRHEVPRRRVRRLGGGPHRGPDPRDTPGRPVAAVGRRDATGPRRRLRGRRPRPPRVPGHLGRRARRDRDDAPRRGRRRARVVRRAVGGRRSLGVRRGGLLRAVPHAGHAGRGASAPRGPSTRARWTRRARTRD